MGAVIVALVRKTEGGRRPIGLFSSMIRLWMQMRLPISQAWMRDHERPILYAGAEKGAMVAAWKQAARAEATACASADYATIMLSFVKA